VYIVSIVGQITIMESIDSPDDVQINCFYVNIGLWLMANLLFCILIYFKTSRGERAKANQLQRESSKSSESLLQRVPSDLW
jgi:hypothetical protein